MQEKKDFKIILTNQEKIKCLTEIKKRLKK